MGDKDVVIVEGVRTPFSKAGTDLKDRHPAELGQIALKELMDRVGIDYEEVDEVIVGNVGNPTDSVNISRVIALRAGFDQKISAYTVHRNCASALQSVTSACDKIWAGQADIVVAGGTENMSQYPLLFNDHFKDILTKVMMGKKTADKVSALLKFKISFLKPRFSVMEGLTDPFVGLNMGQTAEVLAKEFDISRQEQDMFSQNSHKKACEAQKKGAFNSEIVPVPTGPKYKKILTEDVGPRKDQSLEKLAKLKPYFDRKYGTVTVGNSCPITDGACMLLLMSRHKAEELQLKPLAKVRAYSYYGLDPKKMGLGPVYATASVLKKTGLSLKDMGLVELNEAFAAQVIACQKAFSCDAFSSNHLQGLSDKALGELKDDVLNVNGGAIALGHPVGATGGRLVLTLMKSMRRRQVPLGLTTLCIGGGQGGAMILEGEAS